ncbi:MAG: Gfo/Idh/MocA family protein, partial [Candidatus Scatosoma sp.]
MENSKSENKPPVKTFKTAVIGCGRISVMHFDGIARSPLVKLVACCDVDGEKAESAAKKYGCAAYTDYKEMIEKERPDAVHICLPHHLHAPAAQYALQRGVNVLCEKPMTISLADAEAAVALAKEKNLCYAVIFQCRYNAASRLVKRYAQSGSLGKILCVSSVLTWSRSDEYYSSSDWKGTWEKEGGGVVIDQAIHSIDLVNWLVNSPVKNVSVSMANRGHKKVFVEDTADGLIEFENGVKYCFYCTNVFCVDE